MSKIDIQNELGATVTIKYTSTENQITSQTIKSKSLTKTSKEVKPNSSVTVSDGNQIGKSENYEEGIRTLKVYHNHGKLTVQWI